MMMECPPFADDLLDPSKNNWSNATKGLWCITFIFLSQYMRRLCLLCFSENPLNFSQYGTLWRNQWLKFCGDSAKIHWIYQYSITDYFFSVVQYWLKFCEFSLNLRDTHWFKLRVNTRPDKARFHKGRDSAPPNSPIIFKVVLKLYIMFQSQVEQGTRRKWLCCVNKTFVYAIATAKQVCWGVEFTCYDENCNFCGNDSYC